MSQRWDQQGVPHKGWALLDVTDEGDACATCEMCGKQDIRYVHHMRHADHPDLDVGCVCAERMSGDYVTHRRLENQLRSKARSKRGWLGRAWLTSLRGNPRIKVNGYYLSIFPNKFNVSRWSYLIVGRGHQQFSKATYPHEAGAKLALFDAFWELTKGTLGRDPPRKEHGTFNYNQDY